MASKPPGQLAKELGEENKDKIEYFTLQFGESTRVKWWKRLPEKGFALKGHASMLLTTDLFAPPLFDAKIAVIGPKRGRTYGEIMQSAGEKKFKRLDYEAVCLIREQLEKKDFESMGFDKIVVMHKPIKHFVTWCPYLFVVGKDGALDTIPAHSGSGFPESYGFAFFAKKITY